MPICRFHLPGAGARLGWVAGAAVRDLTASGEPACVSLAALFRASVETPLAALLARLDGVALPEYAYAALDITPDPTRPHLLPPLDRQEVWAAGVTYAWSREARVREAVAKEVYVRVYEAARPELFFKALPEKVVGPRDWVGIRGDSRWNVPEPELTLALNPAMEIIGCTIGNDMSSRDIEGENPLYLPQAKIYRHSCALGPAITLVGEGLDPMNLAVRLVISRAGQALFAGETHTSRIHRRLEELARYLGLYDDFPQGAFLLTGTGIVPPDTLSLMDGDEVSIEIEGLGRLVNVVRGM